MAHGEDWSGATAVQIVHSTRRGSRDIEHLGSAHDEAELEALKAAAWQRLAQDQLELDPGLEAAAGAGPLEITASRMAHLRLAARYWDLDDPTRAADLAGILAEDQVRLVIHPETVNRYAY